MGWTWIVRCTPESPTVYRQRDARVGKVEQCLSPVLANCSGVDQVALFHKKRGYVGQHFRRDPVDRREAVLDLFHPLQYRRDPRHCIIDLGTDPVLELAFVIVTFTKPP